MPEFFGKRVYLILFGLIFISMIILTIHFREGVDGPIHRAQRAVMAATSPLSAAVTRAVMPIKDGWDYLVHFGDLTRENRELRQELAEAKAHITELQNIKRENERLHGLVGLRKHASYRGVAANVVGMPTSNWWSSVIVDKGSADGVERSMPVLAGGGLIGQVADVSSRYSKIILLNDVQSGVSVQVQRTGEVGVIKGQLRGKKLVLQYISRDSTIKLGDVVVTSGLGGIFPRGLIIGKVSAVRDSSYSLYKTVEVAGPIDFGMLNEVLIIEREAVVIPGARR